MEGKRVLFAVLFSMIGFSGVAQATPPPGTAKEVLVAVSAAYVPDAQSVNDDALVVPSGMFPNSCYTWSRAEMRSITDFDHEIRAYAWVSNPPCLMYMKPFNQEVRLGRLTAGTHRIRFVSHDDTFLDKTLLIR